MSERIDDRRRQSDNNTHVVLPQMVPEITPEMAEDLCERDVIVALTFWSGRHNRWHVDAWSDDLTTIDVTNVAGMDSLRHERVPLEDVVVVTVAEPDGNV